MFKIAQSPTYSWPVKGSLPGNGVRLDYDFDVTFLRVSHERVEEIRKLLTEEIPDWIPLCKELVQGWKRVHAEDGSEVEFSSGALDEMLKIVGLSSAIMSAFFKSHTEDLRRKN